jgi:hypothetical protein
MNRLLFVIPHFYRHDPSAALGSRRDDAEVRGNAIARTVTRLYETFGPSAMVRPELRAAAAARHTVDVVVVTTGTDHLLDELGRVPQLVHHERTVVPPLDLPFAAHRVLSREASRYDAFGYLEDDIAVHDPFLFDKQRWFGSVAGDDSLLMPARYETSGGAKVYPDADLPGMALEQLTLPSGPPSVATRWMDLDLAFVRPSNPHAGCFFVDAAQMERLARHRTFGVPNRAFVGPLETAATAAVTETFRVYKAASPHTDFLEVEHQGSRYLSAWGIPPAAHVIETERRTAEARAHVAEAEASSARAAEVSARREMEELKGSRSWRMTAPVRRLGDAVARVRRADNQRPTGG